MSSRRISRRMFLSTTAAAGVGAALAPSWRALAEETAGTGPDVWVLHGADPVKLMDRALQVIFANGGLGNGTDRLTLKVNAAWTRDPETGANTHPALAKRFLEGCREAGVKKLTVPEHPCHPGEKAFVKNGLREAVESAGARMVDLGETTGSFKAHEIPGGRTLKEAEVAREFTETDCLINMPVAKHHRGATLTMGMKNWMGAVQDRRYWHGHGLHQCIADFSTFIEPNWTIIDATRIMVDSGPVGPGTVKHPELLVVSKDPIAADAFACTLFHDSIERVRYLKLAREMGLGETHLEAMNLHRLEV